MLLVLAALTAATPQPAIAANPLPVFKANGRRFDGKRKETCVIVGEWDDGESFRFDAWDRCEKMVMDYVLPEGEDRVIRQVHGIDEDFLVPAGHEGYTFYNDFSGVFVFRDKEGRLKEILISD